MTLAVLSFGLLILAAALDIFTPGPCVRPVFQFLGGVFMGLGLLAVMVNL